MAKFRVTDLLLRTVFAANLVVAVLMLVTGYSYLVDPSKMGVTATWGLALPFFAVLNGLFLVFWLLVKPTRILLPFLAFILCHFPIRMYVGINPSRDMPEGCMKVMSYNVLNFRGPEGCKLSRDSNRLAQFLIESDCDIICLQEAEENISKSMKEKLRSCYPNYRADIRERGGTKLAVYTKYPILKADTIPYESSTNLSMAYTLQTPRGTVLVINNHLQTNGLTIEEREDFHSLMKGEMQKEAAKEEARTIIGKLTEAAVTRNPQAKAVAQYVAQHKDMQIILCGDFNENPVSYNHHIIEKGLLDCFIESGQGLGWSYCHNAMRVRIDNIMCSKNITPYGCKVLSDIPYSDHYPIVCWLHFPQNGGHGRGKP